MKTIRFAAFIVTTCLVFATAAHAQNLLVNGDFETNALTPWVASGDVVVSCGFGPGLGSYSCFFNSTVGADNSSIQQTVTTKAGSAYYVSMDIGTSGLPGYTDMQITATAMGAGSPDNSRSFEIRGPSLGGHYSLTFIASSTSTVITIGQSAAASLVDNIRLIELPPNKHAGKYTGTEQATLSSTEIKLVNKTTTNLVARILPTGQIVILEGSSEIAGGILLPDNTLDLRLHGTRQVLTPDIRGLRLSFTSEKAIGDHLDEGLNALDAGIALTIKLTRVGK